MLTRFLVGDYVSSDGLREPVVIRVRHGSQLECPADPLSVVGVKQTLCTSCDFACAASAPSEAAGSAARVGGRGPEDNDLAGREGEARWGWRSMVPTARPRYAHSWYAHAQSQCCRGSPRHVDFPPPRLPLCEGNDLLEGKAAEDHGFWGSKVGVAGPLEVVEPLDIHVPWVTRDRARNSVLTGRGLCLLITRH